MAGLLDNDPYAQLRNLQLGQWSYTTPGLTDQEAGAHMREDQTYSGWAPANSITEVNGGTAANGDWNLGGFQSKYNQIKEVEGHPGLLQMTVQRQDPGANHKYDTQEIFYQIDQNGQPQMVGEPIDSRQISSAERFRDVMEQKILPAAAIIVGGAYAMSAMGGAAAGGAGAGTGAGAGAGAMTAEQAAMLAANVPVGNAGGLAAWEAAAGAAAGGAGAGAGGYVSPELVGGSFGPGSAQLGAAEYAAAGAAPSTGGAWNGTDFSGGTSSLTGGAGKAAGTGLLSGLGGYGDLAKLGVTALGAYEGYKGNDPATSTNVKTLDPRIDSRVFGQDGLLASADDHFQTNKATGQNDTMRQAQEWLRGMLTSPEMSQGLRSQYGASQGLLNMQPNPFTWPPKG